MAAEISCTTKGMGWNKALRTLGVEASTLGLKAGCWPEKIRVRSHHTGVERVFECNGRMNFAAGEMTSVEYVAGDVLLYVFND